ncbi:hypothetical protein [Microbispora sp. H11081]|uniref:hypothetical protein n=1 Tax=Microbispora sp. H11081 TaxID=2729107 RepID=UPI0014761138|nr:hypothetical protein [Microbispora sp. H11081]
MATAPTTRRLTLAALVIMVVGSAAAQPASARVAPRHPQQGLTAFRAPGPGGGGGGQVISGGLAGGAQAQSGQGYSNQSLTGVISPTFVQGRAQQAITDQGGFEVQSTYCGSEPDSCLVGQNMPVRQWGSTSGVAQPGMSQPGVAQRGRQRPAATGAVKRRDGRISHPTRRSAGALPARRHG